MTNKDNAVTDKGLVKLTDEEVKDAIAGISTLNTASIYGELLQAQDRKTRDYWIAHEAAAVKAERERTIEAAFIVLGECGRLKGVYNAHDRELDAEYFGPKIKARLGKEKQ